MTMEIKEILPLDEHIKLLLNEKELNEPCDECELSELEAEVPPWFDLEKFQRGQKYMRDNLYAQLLVMLAGLVCVLSVPSILIILVKTQKSSTVLSAYRRYLSTTDHVYSWFEEDLKPGSISWQSLLTVRARHLRASKTSVKKGTGHITQRDLVLTQFGFFGLGLIRPKMTGLHFNSDHELEGLVHFWRTIGFMIGIDDKYNLCRPSVEETKKICLLVSDEVFKPYILSPPEHFYFMASVLIEGMSYINPFLSEGSFLYFIYRLLSVEGFNYTENEKKHAKIRELECQNNNKVEIEKIKSKNIDKGDGYDSVTGKKLLGEEFYNGLGWYNRTLVFLMIRTFERTLKTDIGRSYYNRQMKVTRFLVKHFPFLCFWRFGFVKSYVNMFAEDIPMAAELKTNKEMLVSRQY